MRLVTQVAEALDAAARDGLVHPDVRPSNVLITPRDFVYVINFGGGRSPDVAAPGPTEARSDVASLAYLLHECLTAEPSGSGLPAGLLAVVARGTAPEPSERYATAGALAEAARQALDVDERPPEIGDHPGRTERSTMTSSPLEIVAGALVVVVAVVLVAFTVARGTDRPLAAPQPQQIPVEPLGVGTSHAVPAVSDLVPTPPAPGDMAITPDGRLGYITNRDLRTVTVMDLLSRGTVATIPMPATPRHLVLDRAGARAYVSCDDDGGTHQLAVVDMQTQAVTTVVPVARGPSELALTPDERTLWVSGHGAGMVELVDTASDTVVRTVPVPANPRGVVLTAERAYVVSRGSNLVTVLDPADATVLSTIPVGESPTSLGLSPDGSRLAVVNEGDNTVSMIDTATARVAATVTVGRGPQDVAFAPDGQYLYTADMVDGTVSAIDAVTDAITATVQVGGAPTSVAPGPHGRLAYVTLLDESRLATLSIGH